MILDNLRNADVATFENLVNSYVYNPADLEEFMLDITALISRTKLWFENLKTTQQYFSDKLLINNWFAMHRNLVDKVPDALYKEHVAKMEQWNNVILNAQLPQYYSDYDAYIVSIDETLTKIFTTTFQNNVTNAMNQVATIASNIGTQVANTASPILWVMNNPLASAAIVLGGAAFVYFVPYVLIYKGLYARK